ncbi:MAG: hypothetical protein GC200_12280 [Tepidisphaera sp.]|nr:hypothetical protein [Tepidisphaera sp.]
MSVEPEKLLCILSIGHDTSCRGKGLTLRDALSQADYANLRPLFTHSDLIPLIDAHPDLAMQWLMYSEDKRTDGGFALTEQGAVGRRLSRGNWEWTIFSSQAEAVANYVILELDFWQAIN